MTFDLTDKEAALLKKLNSLIDGNRYFLSDRIKILKAIRTKIRPETAREPTTAEAICPAADDGRKETTGRTLRPAETSGF